MLLDLRGLNPGPPGLGEIISRVALSYSVRVPVPNMAFDNCIIIDCGPEGMMLVGFGLLVFVVGFGGDRCIISDGGPERSQ